MKSACISLTSLFATAVLAVLAIACTTTTTTTTPNPTTEQPKPTEPTGNAKPKPPEDKPADTTSSSGGSSGSSGSSGASSSGSTGAPAGPYDACIATTDQATCADCCTKLHQDGADVYLGALVECICKPDNCGVTGCGDTLCNATTPANPDAACNNCITQKAQSACTGDVGAACGASPECVSFNQCLNTAGCPSKP